MRARNPERVDAIVAEARRYRRTLERLGVRDPWAIELVTVHPGAIAAALARLLLAAPLAAVGAILGWIPYRVAGWVAARVTRDDDLLGTVKLFAGVLFLSVGWAIEATAAAVVWGPAWAPPVFRNRRGHRICGPAVRGMASRGRRGGAARFLAGFSISHRAEAGGAAARTGRDGRPRLRRGALSSFSPSDGPRGRISREGSRAGRLRRAGSKTRPPRNQRRVARRG